MRSRFGFSVASTGSQPEHVPRGAALISWCQAQAGVRGEVRGVTVIDDFAHHPTAVRETLRALRMRYPGRRLVAVFEPRSATSRRKVFQKDYADAFMEADSIFIAAPYDQSRIAADDQFSSAQLVGDLQGHGKRAQVMDTVEEGVAQVARQSGLGRRRGCALQWWVRRIYFETARAFCSKQKLRSSSPYFRLTDFGISDLLRSLNSKSMDSSEGSTVARR